MIEAIKNVTDETDVVIVGAGAAGLAAARDLSVSNFNVVVLEARDRIGGRINTHFDSKSPAPIELGAEFVHGKPPEIFKLAERTRVTLLELPNIHWYFRNAVLSQSNEFWSNIEEAIGEMAELIGPDKSFEEFIDDYCRRNDVDDMRPMATLYVEGFHAAHADRISVKGLNKTNRAAAEIDDEKQFRPSSGYLPLMQKLYDEAVEQGATFRLGVVVQEVTWNSGSVIVNTTDGQRFIAKRLLLTVPLGVLQRGSISFVPKLTVKEQAANKLAMGQVVKVVLRFRERFWEGLSLPTDDGKSGELKDLAFIHAPDELPSTWWTQLPVRAPLLVGWAGGTRAETLQSSSHDALRDQSLKALSHIFGVSVTSLEEQLEEFYTHNWATDPFALGAYSYIPVDGLDAQKDLAEPVENTIYFAGEAINTTGHHGTVHGALASGWHAAGLIQQSS